jgi:hypothetical protein
MSKENDPQKVTAEDALNSFKEGPGEEEYPTVSIPEMFQYMWTVEPEMAYPRNSPEFLRIT